MTVPLAFYPSLVLAYSGIVGALLGDGRKREQLLSAVYETQFRAERAAIVDALARQAEAIWGIRLEA